MLENVLSLQKAEAVTPEVPFAAFSRTSCLFNSCNPVPLTTTTTTDN